MIFRAMFCLLAFVTACQPRTNQKIIVVKNSLSIPRTEIIQIPLQEISTDTSNHRNLYLLDGANVLTSQLIDYDQDGEDDFIISLLSVGAGEKKKLRVMQHDGPDTQRESKVYSRFVPERIDDFAWENDLVAFRTYGPEAQRLVESGEPGGTLSSGIDCWLKRVDYLVIDKWYEKNLRGGSYHQDDGEGYDPYHVGMSRGCGGIGVWMNDSLFASRNFTSWKIIATGPIRNIFELQYEPWSANGVTIKEKKRISIDARSQLMLIEEFVAPSQPIPHLTIGLTLHDGKGTVFADSVRGFFGYWEKIDESHLGTGLFVNPGAILSFEDHRSAKPDENHIFINVKANERISYYAGFGWDKAGRITSLENWKKYLEEFSLRLQNPLIVSVSN